MEKLALHTPISQYRHKMGEDNADAHLKQQVMGREVAVAITTGKLISASGNRSSALNLKGDGGKGCW